MMVYIHEMDKTRLAFDGEGFLHTGDVGYINAHDCLHITGRIKELLVTAGGENIAPLPVEDYVKRMCPALSSLCVSSTVDSVSFTALVCGCRCDVGRSSSSASHATLTTIAQYCFWSRTMMAWRGVARVRAQGHPGTYIYNHGICVSSDCSSG